MQNRLFSFGRVILFLAVFGVPFSWNASATVPVIVEYAVPSADSHPLGITAGPDGALWFTGYAVGNAGGIGRMTTAGAFSGYTFPFPPGPPHHTIAITPGPDGALWFTWETFCDDNSGVSTITMDGVITNRANTGTSCGILDITAGPDGAMWYTSPKTPRAISGSIVRTVIEGTAGNSYFVGAGDECTGTGNPFYGRIPIGITTGPDGALWFTAGYWNFPCKYIGRITTAGALTNFQLPANMSANRITSGPDGALWFAGGSNIGRITTEGIVSVYPIPTPNSGASHIAVGPDGALWFNEYNTNKIGRITTSGEITEYAIPTPDSGVSGITTGPDGALWFTEKAANKIGRLVLIPSTIPELRSIVLESSALNSGQKNSLTGKLDSARASIDRGNVFPACNKIDAFTYEVNSLAQDNLFDASTASKLVDGAQEVERSLGCAP